MKYCIFLLKFLLGGFWLAFGVSLIDPSFIMYSTIVKYVAFGLLALHVIELFVFRNMVVARNEIVPDVVKVIMFGILHLFVIKKSEQR